MKKRALIIGAGPAGLATAYSLSEKLNVTLIDQGKNTKDRICPSPEKCIKCKICNKSKGVGGAGLFSDGKFIFETIMGKRAVGSNLYELIGGEKEQQYLKKARKFFENYFGKTIKNPNKEVLRKANEISRIAARHDMDYILAMNQHIGTDKLPELIDRIQTDLLKKGIEISTQEKILDFNEERIFSDKRELEYDFLIIAPGRGGSIWLEKLLRKKSIEYSFRTIDIGVRIETDARVLEELVKVERDVKLSFSMENGDLIRTFCVCPNGVVTRETYEDGYNLVNGASDSKNISLNTNFALLVHMPLKHNAKSNEFGELIARIFYTHSVEKPTVQRFGDIKLDRSSKESKIQEWRIKPTLKDVIVGDIGIGMPYRFERDLIKAIERLSVPGLMQGLNQDSTLIYGPEIKFHGINIKSNSYLESCSYKNLYMIGDGAGASRGIGGAIASGLLAADGILERIK